MLFNRCVLEKLYSKPKLHASTPSVFKKFLPWEFFKSTSLSDGGLARMELSRLKCRTPQWS